MGFKRYGLPWTLIRIADVLGSYWHVLRSGVKFYLVGTLIYTISDRLQADRKFVLKYLK